MSRKKLMLLGGVGVAALLTFGALFAFLAGGSALDSAGKLDFAMALLDDGRWDLANRLARDLDKAGSIDKEQDTAWHYVQGVSKLQSVIDDLDTPKNRQVLLEATEHLKKSDELGFPLGYQGKGDFHLGACLFHTYRWDEAIEKLEDVPIAWPARRSEAYRMMVDAQLGKKPSDMAAAATTLAQWEAVPGKSKRELASWLVASAQLAFLKRDNPACEQTLTQVEKNIPEYFEGLLWRGRWRIDAAQNRQLSVPAREKLAFDAEAILREVIVAPNTPNGMRRQAAYLSGKNLRHQGRIKEALGTLNGVRQRNPNSSEAIAAGIEEAELLVEIGHLDDALTTVHYVLRNIEDIKLYNGQWIPLEELRTRLLDISRLLLNQKEFDRVIQFADFLSLAFPLNDTVRLQAETYVQWGEDLADSPVISTFDAHSERRQRLNDLYEMAGNKFEELARLELRSSDYSQILWQAAESFRKANNLRKANEFLTDYLRFEDRIKRARGFVALGRNYIHAGEWLKSLEPLERCLIEYPTNPVSYEARLLAARAKNELGELTQAIELLESNLSDFQLDPQSPVWKDSLFELGQTIFQRGDQLLLTSETTPAVVDNLEASNRDFLNAIERLSEAVARYPDDPRYFDARYMLAKSYRLAAQLPEQMVASQPSMMDSSRRDYLQQRRVLLENALERFRSLHQAINGRQDATSTTEQTSAIVRNCYFGEADCLFELERWEEAILAYRNAASRFLNQPESLEALVQLAVCHRKLGREFEAKKALAQAEQVLRRIPADYDTRFVTATRANREEWEELIGWLRDWN